MKKALPTFIEETAQTLDSMIVSAGRVGLQAELAPGDLARITGAVFCDLV
jgi:Cys-tRNA(Pro)/Cys-tRNA(Cys) deacylase